MNWTIAATEMRSAAPLTMAGETRCCVQSLLGERDRAGVVMLSGGLTTLIRCRKDAKLLAQVMSGSLGLGGQEAPGFGVGVLESFTVTVTE